MKYLAWFLLIICAPLQAEVDLDYYFSLSLEEILKIKVTGSTLTEQSMKTVPSAVTVFHHEEIKNMGLDSLDELMILVPGFQSYRSSFSALHKPFSARGRRISPSSSEVLLLIDGQRIEDSSTSGSAEIMPKVPLANIERVEFIRGPGAAVYGSNAMMGVVNIITRSEVNKLQASGGSFDRRQAHLQFTQEFNDVTLDMFVNLDKNNGEDFQLLDTYSNDLINSNDPHELAQLNIKLKGQDLQVNFFHSQYLGNNFYELDSISNGFNRRKTRVNTLSLKQNFDWHPVQSWLWLGYSQTAIDISAQLTAPGELQAISSPASADPLFFRGNFDDFSDKRIQLHNDWDIDPQNQLQFGMEYRQINGDEVIAQNNFDMTALAANSNSVPFFNSLQATTVLYSGSARDIVGIYGQYQREIHNKNHITLGLRFDDFSNIGSEISPRLGLVHEVNEHHSLKLLYGTAFRAPTETELDLTNNPVLLGNQNLKAETVQSWDLIWLGLWPETSLSLGYFENRFENAIVQASVSTGLSQFKNVDMDPVKGFEFELSQELNEFLLVRASYTHMTENSELSFREAQQLASLMLNYQKEQFNANLIASYQGSREMPSATNSRLQLKEYWQLFTKLSYRFKPQWSGFIQVKNALNENYQTPSINTGLKEGVVNRGREFLLGLELEF